MLPTVSVIGLGWLGLPLAQHLISKGYRVTGSVTSADKSVRLRNAGVDNRLLSLTPEPQGAAYEDLFASDVLVINIAPGMLPSASVPDKTLYARQVAAVRDLALRHGVRKILYTSSTSIYPDRNGIVREADLLTEENTGSESIFRAEQALRAPATDYDLTILRLGGLIGYNRVPGKHFAGGEQVAGHPPVNYIHRDDAVRLIAWVIGEGLWNETFNAIAPAHPVRKEVYERNADLLGFAPPVSYEHPERTPWKEVAADRLVAAGFSFLYPDPLDFPYDPS